jgi:hypothetical protein
LGRQGDGDASRGVAAARSEAGIDGGAQLRRGDLALAIPYGAVAAGLYICHSAWLAILLYHLGIVLCLAPSVSRRVARGLSRGWSPKAALPLVLASAASGPLLVLLWPEIALDPGNLSGGLAAFGLRGAPWWIFAVYYVTLHPVLEEAFWRSPEGPRGAAVLGATGITWGDLAFAGYHALVLRFFIPPLWNALVVLVLVLPAAAWRRVAERRGGQAVPVLAHAVAGVSTMIAVCVLAGML